MSGHFNSLFKDAEECDQNLRRETFDNGSLPAYASTCNSESGSVLSPPPQLARLSPHTRSASRQARRLGGTARAG